MTQRGYAKGRARRVEILDAALAVFGEVGYRAASLREIAARAGLTHPGLLHHFPTKQALLMAVLERRDEVAEEALATSGATGAQELRALVDLVAGNAGRRDIVELFATLSAEATAPEHPAHDYFVGRYRRVRAGIAAAFEEARRDGDLRSGIDPHDAAAELVALMDGLQVLWLYSPASVDMAAVVARHLERQLLGPGRRETPHAEGPPAEAPPAEAPPAKGPPAEGPPAEAATSEESR